MLQLLCGAIARRTNTVEVASVLPQHKVNEVVETDVGMPLCAALLPAQLSASLLANRKRAGAEKRAYKH